VPVLFSFCGWFSIFHACNLKERKGSDFVVPLFVTEDVVALQPAVRSCNSCALAAAAADLVVMGWFFLSPDILPLLAPLLLVFFFFSRPTHFLWHFMLLHLLPFFH